MSEIIYEDPSRGLVMRADEGYADEYVDLLRDTVWGTEGLCYRDLAVERELARIPRFRMIRLLRGETLIGAYGLAGKVISVGEARVPALHRAYLAVDRAHQGQGYGKLLVTEVKRHYLDEAERPVMLYGYIETQNSRSLDLARQAGYRCIGTFQTVLFSRFRPRPHPAVERPGDEAELRRHLEEQYAGFALRDLDQSLLPSRYYLVRRGGEMVAGLQAHRKRYAIVALPGWWGNLLLRVLPDGVVDLISVGNIYCPPGQEQELCRLIEGVLASSGAHVAVAFLDHDAPLLARLRAGSELGLLSRLGVAPTAHVMAGFNGIGEEIVEALVARPLFISPLDPA